VSDQSENSGTYHETAIAAHSGPQYSTLEASDPIHPLHDLSSGISKPRKKRRKEAGMMGILDAAANTHKGS